ncbi:MAG: hypothetical protein P8184_19150, partial [Calditrichia bacterium]
MGQYKIFSLTLILLSFLGQDALIAQEFVTGNKIVVQVRGLVSKNGPNYEYNYNLKSLRASEQNIWNFKIILRFNPDSISQKFRVQGWLPPRYPKNDALSWISWSAPDNKEIFPGDSASGFGFLTRLLPGITDFYAEGAHPIPSFEEGMAPDSIKGYDDLTPYGPGIIGKTIGPVQYPSPLEPESFIDTLLNCSTRAYSLNWISNSKIIEKYAAYLQNAKERLQQNDNTAAFSILDSVLIDVQA